MIQVQMTPKYNSISFVQMYNFVEIFTKVIRSVSTRSC